MYPKVKLVEEIKEEGKKERKIVNNNERHHICLETRQKETVEQYMIVEKIKEIHWRGVRLM
jgi:hypothetical protein